MRPRVVCYCDALPQVRPRTRVVIVQHPRERMHPLNTARIVERSVIGSRLVSAGPRSLGAALEKLKLPEDTALLYPCADAEPLEELPKDQIPSHIIVVDGTWHHAKTLLRDVPELNRFRRVRFSPDHPSNYRIRREPREDYLSTVESVHHALTRIESDTPGLDRLLACFDTMVDRNLAARRPEAREERFRSRSQTRPHRFPVQLAEGEDEMMIVYAEGTSRFAELGSAGHRAGRKGKEPLVVAMGRSGDARPQLFWCETKGRVPERLLNHLGVEEESIRELLRPPPVVREAVQRRLRDARVTVAWNASTLRILEEVGVVVPAPLHLKAAYCGHRLYLAARGETTLPERWGEMDDVLGRHGLQAAALPKNRRTDHDRVYIRWQQTRQLLSWMKGLRDVDSAPNFESDCIG